MATPIKCESDGSQIYLGIKGLCDRNSNYGTPLRVYFTSPDFEVSEDDFLLELTFQKAARAGQIIPIDFDSLKWEDEPTKWFTSETGRKYKSAGTVYNVRISLNTSVCLKQEIAKLDGWVGGMMIVYDQGYIQASMSAVDKVRGMNLSIVSVDDEKQKSTDSDTPRMLDIVCTFADKRDLNGFEYTRKMEWSPIDIDGLTLPVFEIATSPAPAATGFTFQARVDCGGKYKPIKGLTVDHITYKVAGVAKTVTMGTADADGFYVIEGTALATGVLDVIPPNTYDVAPDDDDLLAYPALSLVSNPVTVTIA